MTYNEENRQKKTAQQDVVLLQDNLEAVSIHGQSVNHSTEMHYHTGWSREVRDEGVALRKDIRENW